MSVRFPWSSRAVVPCLLVLLAGVAAGQHGPVDFPPSDEPRVPVATVAEAAGLVTSEGIGEPFTRLADNDTVHARDLLVALPGLKATLRPTSGAVALTLWGNLPGLSDSPVLESAVILHDSRAYDLDFTPLRGRVVLTNTRKTGPARVWVRRAYGTGVSLTLAEPGDRAALEIYGRWPVGVPFDPRRGGGAPTLHWELVVLKGNLEIQAGRQSYAMAAPPGPSAFRGDSVLGASPDGPERRSTVPAWADPKAEQPAEAARVAAVVAEYRDRLKAKAAAEAGTELLAASERDPDRERGREARKLYVYAQAATDDLPAVIDALDGARYDEGRKAAVIALRHWIGSAPGRDERLFGALLEAHFSKAEAETVLQLLHSPFAADQPVTYEALIAYLRHRRLAVRELAAWHLYRLAPAGRDIPYDAAAAPEVRERAAAAWKKLIPGGELPPSAKKG